MRITTIDASMIQQAFLAGAKGLEAKKEWINELNVFPVPDGDTGTNMTMTIMAAAKEVAAIENPTIESLAKAISSGSLRGARGNSGVILSQLLRGFTKELKKADKIDVTTLAASLVRATETAYKAVMKPKEGTILTVAKGMSDKAVELAEEVDDIIEFAQAVIAHGDYVLSQTPEMLPVLKQAGVVDSGGQGLMQIVKGAFEGLQGKEVDMSTEIIAQPVNTSTISVEHIDTADIKFGYCTEFIVNTESELEYEEELKLKAYLEGIGDSIVVVADEDVIKIHVHTNDPGLAIQKALTYGSLSRIKIDNMREEHEERLQLTKAQEVPQEKKPYGFVSVSVGEGLGEILRGIGIDYLIEGGQTMNPSTEDMLNAINQVNAETVFIFPNNKNIILAAEQAKYLVEDKEIVVVPTKTVPQGITAMISFVPDLTAEENLETMVEEISRVKTGQVTYAVRNTVIDDVEIHEHDIMGLGDHGILAVGQSVEETTLEMLGAMVDEDAELITIYYGEDISESDAEVIFEKAQAAYPDCEVDLQSGGQPIYYYLISVE